MPFGDDDWKNTAWPWRRVIETSISGFSTAKLIYPLAVALISAALWGASGRANAAEYQGQNIDGRRLHGKAYSYETGGLFEAEIVFQQKQATLYFVNGSEQKVRLSQPKIRDLKNIEATNVGLFNIGGFINFGLTTDRDNNLDRPRPRPFEGFWRVSLNEGELQPQNSSR